MTTASYALQEAENLLKSKMNESGLKCKELDGIACESESTGLGGDPFGSGIEKSYSK